MTTLYFGSVCADITLVVLYILLVFLCVFQFVVDSCADEGVYLAVGFAEVRVRVGGVGMLQFGELGLETLLLASVSTYFR